MKSSVVYLKNLAYLLIFAVLVLSSASAAVQSGVVPSGTAPVKVVALSPHLVELIYEIGAEDTLVAVSAHSDYPKAAELLPVVGDYLNLDIEKILAMEPDLVLAWKGGTPEQSLQQLRSLGLRVEYSFPQQLEDVAAEIEWLGSLLHQSGPAEKVAASYRQRLQRIQLRYHKARWINGFYEIWPNPLTTINDNAWPARHLEVCRIRNVFANTQRDYPQINLEQVLHKQIDLIIQPVSVASPSLGYQWQPWFEVMAVNAGRIIKPDADLMYRMTSRGLTELERLCREADVIRQAIR